MTQREMFARQFEMADDAMLADAAIAMRSMPASEGEREALSAEISRRGLEDRLAEMFEMMEAMADPERVRALAAVIAGRPCPHCGARSGQLHAAESWRVISIVAFAMRRPRVVIGCRSCIDERIRAASRMTMFTGWWSIPWGPIRTMEILRVNRVTREELAGGEWPGEMLLWYVARHGPRLMFDAGSDPDWRPHREVSFGS